MDRRKDTAVEAILEQWMEYGPCEIAETFSRAFELARQIERERFLGAEFYECIAGRHRRNLQPFVQQLKFSGTRASRMPPAIVFNVLFYRCLLSFLARLQKPYQPGS